MANATITEAATAEDVSEGYLHIATMPPAMHAALIDPYSGGAWLWLVEITISGYDTLYYARNNENIVYGGITYVAYNFDLRMSSLTGGGSVPRTTILFTQDADHILEDRLNATEGGYGGTIKIIRTHEDFLTFAIEELEQTIDILNSESDEKIIAISCGLPNPLLMKVPLRRYSSKLCPYALPGLFKGPECQYAGGDGTCTGKLEDCITKSNATHWGGNLGLDPSVSRT